MIADFGLSRVMDDEKFHMLTEICGTPGVSRRIMRIYALTCLGRLAQAVESRPLHLTISRGSWMVTGVMARGEGSPAPGVSGLLAALRAMTKRVNSPLTPTQPA